jgi:TonB family protein
MVALPMLAMLALAGVAAGQGAPMPQLRPPSLTGEPDWSRTPTPEEIAAAFGQGARRPYAFAVILCSVTDQGGLDACSIEQETQPEVGMGRAALSLANGFLLRAAPAGGSVVRICFQFDGAVVRLIPPPPPPPPAPIGAKDGQTPALRPSVITAPDWTAQPTATDLRNTYPREALRKGPEGRAVISCVVAETGQVGQCRLLSEMPEGEGFGAAALALGNKFYMKPQTRDGAPVGGARVNIPIIFKVK